MRGILVLAAISLVRLAGAASPADEAWTVIDKSLMESFRPQTSRARRARDHTEAK